MLLRRREVSFGLAAFAATPLLAQQRSWQDTLQDAIQQNSPVTLGHKLPPPSSPLWAQAHALLDAAPTGVPPIAVARYFETSVPAEFQRAWPEPNPANPTLANPLIVLFFLATNMKPSGDQTAWCSAFMNWCVRRSGAQGTGSASSQSWLHWGSERWHKGQSDMPTSAQPGDIAVFTLKSDPGHGHVAFFSGIRPHAYHQVEIKGGNQLEGRDRIHAINTKSIRTDGNLELRSIRSV